MERERSATTERSATVVVCAFSLERLEQTRECVEALLAQEPRVPQVVVVVDHNRRLGEMLRAAFGPEVEIVPNDGRPGLSSARNTGIRRARGSIVAFVDDDALAAPDWLSTLDRAFEDPEVIAAGGHAVPVWDGARPAEFPEEFLWVVGCSYRGLAASGPVRNVLGCNMAFRAIVFEEVGGFDPAIGRLGSRPLGCEETELCVRARRRFPRAAVVMVGGAVVQHAVPESRQRFAYFWRRCMYEGASKALMRRLTDERALDTERRYATRTLPLAIRRELRSALEGRDVRAALLRIAWVLAGLSSATVGFGAGLLYYTWDPPDHRGHDIMLG